MDTLKIFQNGLSKYSPEEISELRASETNFYPRLQEDSFLEKLEKNFGFIIIGMMLVGAIVWTILMCG